MDKHNLPESFGVFKPVGHTVIAFQTEADMQAAVSALTNEGFQSSSMVRYTPAEMMAQVDAELAAASPMATFGYELNLIKMHRTLAERGCHFLIVDAPKKDQAERVAIVARTMKAVAAQHYGRFMIEELSGLPPSNALNIT